MVNIRKAPRLCPLCAFGSYKDVSTFPQGAFMPWVHQIYLFLHGDNVMLLCWMAWLFGCGAMLNELVLTIK